MIIAEPTAAADAAHQDKPKDDRQTTHTTLALLAPFIEPSGGPSADVLPPELGRHFAQWVEVRRRTSAQSLADLRLPFLAWLKLRRSAKTVESYSASISRFCDYAAEQFIYSPGDVTYRAIEGWLGSLADKGQQPTSLNNRLAALKTWWKWMRREEITIGNPPGDCDRIPIPKSMPRYLTIRETEQLLKGLSKRDGNTARRDEAMIATAVMTGLRVSEICNLRVDDVKLSQGILNVIEGKGKKDREAVIIPRLAKILRAYLRHTRPRLLRRIDSPWLFVSARPMTLRAVRSSKRPKSCPRTIGAQLGRHTFNAVLRKLVPEIISRTDVHPHMLRHSFASRLRQRGADLQIISEALGHSDISTTTRYAHLATDDQQKLLRKILRK